MQIRYPVLLQDEALYLIRVEEALRQLCIAGEIHKPRAPLGGNENENENEKEDEGSLRKADAWRGDNSGQRVGGREPQRGAVGRGGHAHIWSSNGGQAWREQWNEIGNRGRTSQGDLQGYVPKLVDRRMKAVYGYWVHENDGRKLTG